MLQDDYITWNFYLPGSSLIGGFHEASVKSVKYHIHRVVGQSNLTHEKLGTLVKQVKPVLNSRPHTPAGDNMKDLRAITPGHFLKGHPLLAVLEPMMNDVNVNYVKR